MTELAIPIAQEVPEKSCPTKPLFAEFVARTLGWVGAQLTLTAAVCAGMYARRDDVVPYLQSHPVAIWCVALASFITLGLMFASKSTGQRLAAFASFTLSTSCLVGVGILPYSPQAILLAAATTWLIVCAASAYSWRMAMAGRDLDGWGAPLSGVLSLVIVLSIANIFLKLPGLQVVLAGVSVLLFTAYLLYDLTRLYSGREADDPLFQDGLISAVAIYLDIINIFINLLQLIGYRDD